LEVADSINNDRIRTWNTYKNALKSLKKNGIIDLPTIPDCCVHNAHMFYIKCKNLETRQAYIKYMKENDIVCSFHYVPLHSAPAGIKFGRFNGEDKYTSSESDRLVRLPMYYKIDAFDLEKVIDKTLLFFS
nr:DegT/DnrJ/EryC1/StrS family aminotransferase [Paludibacteraceae bacterium]